MHISNTGKLASKDSFERVFTKKIAGITLNTAASGGVALADEVIWKPDPAEGRIQPISVIAIVKALTGNPADWRILLEVGAVAVVASVIPVAVAGEAVNGTFIHAVVASVTSFDYLNPLTLTTTLDAVATVAEVDLVITAVKLGDFYQNS